MARPKKAIKRQEPLMLYYTKSEFRIISKLANEHGMPMAVFARHKTLDHTLSPRLSPEQMELYKKLVGMANTLTSWLIVPMWERPFHSRSSRPWRPSTT